MFGKMKGRTKEEVYLKEVITINAKNTSRGVLILTFTNVLSKVLSLVYIPLLIINIGGAGYGNYNSAYQIYTFIYMVTIAGSSSAIPKLISEYSATGHERDAMASFKLGRTFLIGMGVLMSILLLILTGPFVHMTGFQNSKIAIYVLIPAILITAVSSAYRGYFQGRNNFVPLGISQFIEQFINVVLSLICSFAFMKISLPWGVAGGAIGTAVGALASVIYLKIKYDKDLKSRGRVKSEPRKHSNDHILKYIFKYSWPLIVSALILYAGNNLFDQTIINRSLQYLGYNQVDASTMFGDLGKYTQLINLPMILISSIALSVFPMIARENASDDKTKLREAINKLFKIGFMIGLPSAVGLSVLSGPIFHFIFFKVENTGGALLMQFGGYVFIFSSVYQLTVTMINSLGKVKSGTVTAFITVAVRLIVDIIFIRIAFINIYGAVIGLLLSNYIGMLLNMKIVEKHTMSKESYLRSIIKPAISAAVMGAIMYFVFIAVGAIIGMVLGAPTNGGLIGYISNAISLGITGYIGGVVYLQMMVKIKGMDSDDLAIFPRKVRRLFFM
ncbi:MAG: putative polysaccharide biosynthesis protein [Sarcina sp.]